MSLYEIDLDTEDELRQAVIDAAFAFCETTETYRKNLLESGPSWGVKPPEHFMALHTAIDALIAFKTEADSLNEERQA